MKTMLDTVLTMDIKNFTNEIVNDTRQYAELEKQYAEKVENGLMGYLEKENQLKEYAGTIAEKQAKKSQYYQSKIESIKNEELAYIHSTNEPMTQDTKAELDVIDQLKDDLTADDVNNYIDKYRKNPLAMKRLAQIAKGNDKIHFSVINNLVTREDKLNNLIATIERRANYTTNLNVAQRGNARELAKIGIETMHVSDEINNVVNEYKELR